MLQRFTEDDFFRLFSEPEPKDINPYTEVDRHGDSLRFYRMTCCYCGDVIPRATRRHTLFHSRCRTRRNRERKEFIAQHWLGLVLLYILFTTFENLHSYETKSNTSKS